MPKGLGESEIREIIETYIETGSINKTDEAMNRSRATISKYVNKWKDGELDITVDPDDVGEDEDEGEELVEEATPDDDGTPEGFTAPPPSSSQPDKDTPDFADMAYGEFVKWFFSNKGFGVAENFANNLAEQCDIRGEIPDKAEMANMILKHNSRIANDADAEMLAENYWAVAQKFLRAKGQHPTSRQHAVGGGWVDGDRGGPQQQHGGPGGDWVAPEDAARGQSRANGGGQRGQRGQRARDGGGRRGQGGRQRQQRQQRQQQTRQQRQQDNNGSGVESELVDALNEMKQTQVEILKELNRDKNSQDQKQNLKSQAEQLVEVQNALEKVTQAGGRDDAQDQYISELRDEIREIRDQMRQESSEPVKVDGDNGFTAIAELAARDEVDPETLSVLADTMGVTDPKVKEAEYDFKKTQAKMENRQELLDNFFDNLGNASGDILGSVMEMVSDDDDDEGENAGDARPAEPGMDAGDIQVVGGDDEGEGPDRGGDQPRGGGADKQMSPARRRHADAIEDDDSPGGVGGFRGPSGQDGGVGQVEGGCQYVLDSGDQCGADVLDEGTVFCPEHKEQTEGDL